MKKIKIIGILLIVLFAAGCGSQIKKDDSVMSASASSVNIQSSSNSSEGKQLELEFDIE